MSRESFLKRGDKPSKSFSHIRSRKQERELAKRVKGGLVAGSGSGYLKGDIRKRKVCRIEAKTTKHSSFSVTLEMVRKIEDAALAANELPIIVVEFNNGRGQKIAEVAVVPAYILDSLT